MPRLFLEESHLHPAIRAFVASHHRDVVEEVSAATRQHAVVVVGLQGNPMVGKARKLLASQGVPYHDLVYGSYFSQWRRRNALKLWTGWPTFPMVFVQGSLVGGYTDLQKLVDNCSLATLLKAP